MTKQPMTGKVQMIDPVAGSYTISVSGGKVLMVTRSSDDLKVIDGKTELGKVIISSSWSGSVWVHGRCIGEYAFLDGEYRIVPIDNGYLQPRNAKQMHPVDYMLSCA